VALERMIDRLAEDHARAATIARGLAAIDGRLCDPNRVETNIVMVEIGHTGADARAWVDALAERGVRAGAWNPTALRLVTHRHIDDDGVERAVSAFRSVHSDIVPALALAR
jgi:threonine aldolase